ncbi:MAG: anion permease [Oscillospiraceae bacterium]|nr:anion permease [Oscillospiraceae bacterium]
MLTRRFIHILFGPLFFVLATMFLPDILFSFSASASIGLVFWMAYWWITMPVDTAVTALLPVAVNAIFQLCPMSDIAGKYFSEIVVLLLGADLISTTWAETGFDKRIAMKALGIIGPSLKQQIIVWFLLSALLSLVLPNAVVCAVLVSIAVSMLKNTGDADVSKSRTAMIILAAIAWGSGIGGMGTPLGGAMNLVAVEYIEGLLGSEFLYTDWVVRLMPFLIVIIVINIFYMLLISPKNANLGGSKEFFRQQYATMPPVSRDEKMSLFLFAIPTVLVFMRGLYADRLPGLKPAYTFLIFGIIGFLLPKKGRRPLLTWKCAEKTVSWGLLYLFAGGLALGTLVNNTGAADAIAAIVSEIPFQSEFTLVLTLTAFTILLAEISSNTAAAAISLPVVVSITEGLGRNPIPYIFIISAAFNCAYVLPTSIRAIPVGYGLNPKYLFKNGLVQMVLSILIISCLGYLFLRYTTIINLSL